MFNKIEREFAWPAQISLIVYFLLPKPDGGDRPIVIMAGLVRIRERSRLPQMKKWLSSVVRTYDFAQAGCTAEGTVWLQLLEVEALGDVDGPSAPAIVAILSDLVTCFQRVRLVHVWRWVTLVNA